MRKIKMFRQAQVKSVKVPRYPELNVKNFGTTSRKHQIILFISQIINRVSSPNVTSSSKPWSQSTKSLWLTILDKHQRENLLRISMEITKRFWSPKNCLKRSKLLSITQVSSNLIHLRRNKREISPSSQEVCQSWVQENKEGYQGFVCS